MPGSVIAIVDFNNDHKSRPIIMYSASNAGYARVDLEGNILKQYFIGHVQNLIFPLISKDEVLS